MVLLCLSSICPVVSQAGFIEEPHEGINFYQPFNVYPKSSTSLNPTTQNAKPQTPELAHNKEFDKLLSMKKKIPSHLHMGLEKLASKLKITSTSTGLEETFHPSVFLEGQELEQSVRHAVYILEMYDLTMRDRIWVLAVLQHLQGYLPKGHMKAMKTDMTEGPISYAALQCKFLTFDGDPKLGLNLIGASQAVWEHPWHMSKYIDLSLEEAFFRLTTLVKIKQELDSHPNTEPSRFTKETYDAFLQESTPIPVKNWKIILIKCSKNLAAISVQNWEREISYSVMHWYKRADSSTKKVVEDLKSQDDSFKWIFEREELLKELDYVFKREKISLGPFGKAITPLLSPQNLNINTFKSAAESIKVAKHENEFHETLSPELWAQKEDYIIGWLQKLCPYIDGAKSYLKEQVEWNASKI
ncbi:uncharacterized protein MELLADRAFT_91859 [Melampsora larici-populina 98AG31]|uniref:Secreted protein n=1 Tax=Melampsora larici-populina (strain 98AG31 / pathotype 3-4-7) TaxID=747676 RepID=F4S0M1_MELLP|nr:uncharacterized protein MELLADRAFT_91859 [Melampsora larici-populina 98AG31]EGG01790.1 hypothetical protein MELLADRAFT_91859 [Melampsora larici-populina 98AG31]